MPFSQFGYSYSSAPQLLFSSNALGPCYEAGSTSPLAPASNPLYLPVYEDALVNPARHQLGSSSYGNACVKDHGTYSSHGTDSTCLYSLGKFGEKEESGMALERGTPGSVYYCSDHRFGQYHSEKYGYGTVDANMRRKNTCRETTSTLKAWLQEHKKNPYPTKGEKIMLAIITKLTLTQVSTWFANARRRLKKENKMTWSPRNKNCEKGCEEDVEDLIKSKKDFDDNLREHDTDLPQSDLEDFDTLESDTSESEPKPPLSTGNVAGSRSRDRLIQTSSPETLTKYDKIFDRACFGSTAKDGRHIKTFYSQQDELTYDTKPKIWSLAQTATSLNRGDYTPCMQRGHGMMTPYMECHLDSKREDSPVTTLRNWVDGMFHDPLFRQSSQILNQTPYGLWMAENNFHELTDGLPSFQNAADM